MRMNSEWLRLLLILLLLLFTPFHLIFAQQEETSSPFNIQLTLDRTTLSQGESTQATLLLRNTAPYTLTNVTAQLQGTAFTVSNSPNLPDSLSPHSSVTADYSLQSQNAGSHNVGFVVQYAWDEPNTGSPRQWSEMVVVEGITVTPWPDFDWPDYLIPLLVGLLVGLLSGWFTEWRKQRQEAQQREEQARGVVLAVLQAVRKGVENEEKVSFALWEEAIVQGNLYPALHQLGRSLGKPALSKRLAELSVGLAAYNRRQETGNLTADLASDLIDELTDLIRITENRG